MALILTTHDASAGLRHDLRSVDVTASQVAALYGCGFHTQLALWRAKRDGDRPCADNSSEAMDRGRWLEDAVATMAREKMGDAFEFVRARTYHRVRSDVEPALRLGSTPDYWLRSRDPQDLVLECKTTDEAGYHEHWATGVPLHYALQVLAQLICTGARVGYIAVLVFTRRGCQGHMRKIEYDDALARDMCSRVIRFFRSVEAGVHPPPVLGADSYALDRLTRKAAYKVLDEKSAGERWPGVEELVSRCADRMAAIKALEADQDKDRDALRVAMQDYTTLRTDAATVSYKPRKNGARSLVIRRRK